MNGATHPIPEATSLARGGLVASALPSYPSRLFGREALIAQLEQMLTTGLVRLVTLTGPGGIGKTRVACEVARRLSERFELVRFFDLSNLRDCDAVLPVVLDDITRGGVAGGARGMQRRMLLVLDNFEHLLDAAADLGGLLRDHPNLAMIVTSRAVLGLRWEHAVSVPPLELAEPGEPVDLPGRLAPAVDLFVDALRRHHPDLTLTSESQELVGEICDALEGVPLALELAAARTKLLSLAELRERLREPLDLLRAGDRDLPERQRALRRSLEWSSQLLTPAEHATACQLAVLVGGGTLEIADAIVRLPGDPDGEWLLDALVGLVDNSIIFIDVRDDPVPRFRMLGSARAYYREQLAAMGQLEDTERRLIAWGLAAASHFTAMMSAHPSDAVDAFEREWDNLLAVFEWLLQRDEVADADRLALSLVGFWVSGSCAVEGRVWLDRLLAREVDRAPDVSCALLLARASLALRAAELEQASADVERAAGLLANSPAPSHAARLAVLRASIAQRRGLADEAWSALHSAQALDAATVDPAIGIQLQLVESALAIDRHDLAHATRAAHDAAARAREHRRHELCSLALLQLGGIEILLGHVDSAETTLLRAHEVAMLARSRHASVLARVGQGAIAAERGDVALAMRHYREALASCPAGEALDAMLAALDAIHALSIQPDAPAEIRALSDLSELRALRRLRWVSPLPWLAHLFLDAPPDDDASATGEPREIAGVVEQAVRAVLSQGTLARVEASPPLIITLPGDADDLSIRERQVARYVARGMTNRQIADTLGIAERTVDSHVGNVLRKLRLRTRAGIAAWAVQRGLHGAEADTASVRTGTITDRPLRKG